MPIKWPWGSLKRGHVHNKYELFMNNLPLGVCLLTKSGTLLWTNPHFSYLTGKRMIPGEEYPELLHLPVLHYSGGKFLYFASQELLGAEEKIILLTCQDISEQLRLYTKEQGYLPVIAFAQIDNWEEVQKTMPEETRPLLWGTMERTLKEWVENYEGFMCRVAEGRYLLIFKQWGLKRAIKERFTILDKIRTLELGNALPFTLSLGIGGGEENFGKLGNLARSALDLAQERGGDQVVVKYPGKVRFYGGKSLTMEKKTKIKARFMANTLKELLIQSEQVFIMGHETADFDCLGAALGLLKAVRDLGKKAWLVVDNDDLTNPATKKLLDIFPPEVRAFLLKPDEVGRRRREGTLLVVLDTHKTSLLPAPELLAQAEKVVLIDHHRRGEEFLDNLALTYVESYASSTCELVTELLQYMGEEIKIGKEEATALLAGITVDTKNFIFQTGARTFAAAAYLRSLGADPQTIQRLLQDDLQVVLQKSEVISKTRILYGEIAVSVGSEPSPDAQLLAAKTADAMLNIAGVNAAFVLWPLEKGVTISARSNGKINVQAIMEKLEGGGHLTVAATQLSGTLEEVEKRFLNVLEEVFQKSEEVET